MIKLNVNIDHVATIRQARGGKEPDPVAAAINAEIAGASGIVCHLREDRRHINDRDVKVLREVIQTKMDLEMSANENIIKIALETQPDLVTIVPENRLELTTEGGLDVANNLERYTKLCKRMHEKSIEVSFFIEPEEKQIESALRAGADMVEFHTGVFANQIYRTEIDKEWMRLNTSAINAHNSGLKVAMGHGLNYLNTRKICSIHNITELSIGHSIISRAILVGITQAVKEMLEVINSSSVLHKIQINK